jgi:hypothetical protein
LFFDWELQLLGQQHWNPNQKKKVRYLIGSNDVGALLETEEIAEEGLDKSRDLYNLPRIQDL